MSVIEQIAKKSAKLPVARQREVLDFVEFVASRPERSVSVGEPTTTSKRKTIKPVRKGWSAAFGRMRRNGDDALLDNQTECSTAWDEKEWEW